MSDLAEIDVQVLQDRDLVVTRPGASPVLVLMDSMRMDPDPERARFLVSAWRAAHAKAQQLGWLSS